MKNWKEGKIILELQNTFTGKNFKACHLFLAILALLEALLEALSF